MNTKPILFNTPMVQAISACIKWNTRRTRGLEIYNKDPERYMFHHFFDGVQHLYDLETNEIITIKCPYGQLGDVLWVRETFFKHEMILNDDDYIRYIYKADMKGFYPKFKWKPSIHMPKEAARFFLKIMYIKVERLQDISISDIKDEGVQLADLKLGVKDSAMSYLNEKNITHDKITPAHLYMAHWFELWCNVNGRESWDANPWVWVIDFRRIEKPLNF